MIIVIPCKEPKRDFLFLCRGAKGGTRQRNGVPKEELDRGMRIRGAEGGTRKRNGAPKEELERGMRIRGAEGGTRKRNENSRPQAEELDGGMQIRDL